MLLHGQVVLTLMVACSVSGRRRACEANRDIKQILVHPCGGNCNVTVEGRRRRETQDPDISKEAGRAWELAKKLEQKYNDKSSRKIRISDQYREHLRSTTYFNLSDSSLNYDDIAVIAFVVDIAFTQERHFRKDLRKLEDAVIHLLCKVKIAESARCSSCPARNSADIRGCRDLRPYPCNTTNVAQRRDRDFIVIRDAASYLKKVQNTSELHCRQCG